MSSSFASHGRGGAGNMAKSSDSPKLSATDLQTPTLKTSVVTTGRGGQGNMAKNTDPAETRLRQDVDPVLRRESYGAQYAGRGGAGNVFKGEDVSNLETTDAVVDDDSSFDATGPKEKTGEKLEKVSSKGKGWFGKKA